MSRGPLDDACLVVRGGVMQITSLRSSLQTCKARMSFYGLSFWGDDRLTFEEICARARLRNLVVRTSTVGRLRSLGHEPRRSGRTPHLTVRFEVFPTDEELEGLVGAFDPPVPNPYPAD